MVLIWLHGMGEDLKDTQLNTQNAALNVDLLKIALMGKNDAPNIISQFFLMNYFNLPFCY